MKCKICGNSSNLIFNKKIINKYNVDFFQCTNCEFIQTEEPYWLDEAYEDTINTQDTGLLGRNIHLSNISSLVINIYFKREDCFLDYGGGYGVLTRLMRDKKFNYYWKDPYTTNLFSKEYEWNGEKEIKMLTSFETFEHFIDPLKEIKEMLKIGKNILFTTELVPSEDIENWWYLGFDHGQHVSFYSLKSLQIIAQKNNLYLSTDGKNMHLLSSKHKKYNMKLIKFLVRLNLSFEKLLNKYKK